MKNQYEKTNWKWFRGYKVYNDMGHKIIRDRNDRFMGSCDSHELNQRIDEIESEG